MTRLLNRPRRSTRFPNAAAIVCTVICIALLVPGAIAADAPRKVIIDADPAIGVRFKDVDDGLMLIVALNSPELEVLGITTTFGNGSEEISYEKANEIIDLTGRHDVPVLRGADAGDPQWRETEASRFIIDMAYRYPGEVTVLAVGPVTNVATALKHAPEIGAKLKEVVSMGGNVSAADIANTQCYTDLNYGSDMESAGLFLESVPNLTVVSIQTSERFFISPSRYERLTSETEYADYLSRTTRFWYWLQRRVFIVWDLVALACLVNPDWFEPVEATIDYVITPTGNPRLVQPHAPGSRPTVNIPEFRTDLDQFWDWVFARL